MVRKGLTFKRFVVRIIGRWGGAIVADGAAGNGSTSEIVSQVRAGWMVREVLTFKRFVVRIIGRWGGAVVAKGAAGNGTTSEVVSPVWVHGVRRCSKCGRRCAENAV